MSVRLPGGCDSPAAFWEFLQRGTGRLGSLSTRGLKWPEFIDADGAHRGIDRAYLLDDVVAQDMEFFGISTKEAELMDPQQRLLLELSWEAFESAGYRPSAQGGSSTGVFIGACLSDYRELIVNRARSAEAYVGTGTCPCVLANRISYQYNLKGPCLTVDTACSSSLSALADAVSAIGRGECTQALVGAVNLILAPTSSIWCYQGGMLSSQTTCNPFDDESDGYIRGEGAGMLLVKPLQQARRDGDTVLAVIKGIAVNHGGRGRSLTAPNALSQSMVITAAFEKAEVPVDTVTYIETHGTGTPVGDPIEIHGLTRAFRHLARRQGRELAPQHCALGALKASIGHCEGAAGMASIIKVLLAMQHRRVPPNPRLTSINRRIDLAASPFFLVREGREWLPCLDAQGRALPLRAGISSFGFGGTNAHLLLESADPIQAENAHPAQPLATLFALSARTDAQLHAYARKYLDWLSADQSARLEDIAVTALAGREAMARRFAAVVETTEELRTALRSFLEHSPAERSYVQAGASAEVAADPSLERALERRDLDALARAWVAGAEGDPASLYADRGRKLPFAPTYPFERRRFWLPWPAEERMLPGSEALHPLLRENISNFRRQAYRIRFSAQQPPVAGHRVAGRSVVPGMAFVVLAQYAIAASLGWDRARASSGGLQLAAIRWLRPLAVEEHPEPVELRVRPLGNEFEFEFVDSSGTCVCTGRASATRTVPAPAREDFAAREPGAVLSAEECYERCRRLGLEYGPAFRVIERIDRAKSYLTAHLTVSQGDEADALPVALLDGVLQACVGALTESGLLGGQLFLPAEVESVEIAAPCERRMRAFLHPEPHAPAEQDLQYFSATLCNESGQVCVRLNRVRVARASREDFLALVRREARSDAAVGVAPEAAPAPITQADIVGRQAPHVALVKSELAEIAAKLLRADSGSIDATRRFSDYGIDSLLLVGLIRQVNARWNCKLAPTAAFAHPTVEALAAHIADLADAPALRSAPTAAPGEQQRASLPVQARPARTGGTYQAVLLREPCELEAVAIGSLPEPELGPEDVVVAVRAFSLNFGDLLCVSGFYPDMPDYPFTPGFEASGVVAAVGPRVRELRPGDAVVVMTGRSLGAHANRVQCHQERVFKLPAGLDFEGGCALPVVAVTVLEAFAKAQPRAGERILIQSACGGVGLAAVQLARHHGAEIYATAGSEVKLEHLRSIGIRHAINYRERDFESWIGEITGGRGVDVVLNTLPGEALQKGLNCLAPGGRYVEMALTALKAANRVDLSAFGDNQAFFSVNLRKLSVHQPARLRAYFDEMTKLVATGVLHPVIAQSLPFDQYAQACRFLASRRSIGKVIVTIPEHMRHAGEMSPLRQQARARERPLDTPEPVAIIGMSGRFAQSENLQELWQHLAQGDDLVTTVTRWDLSRQHAGSGRAFCDRGSFLTEIDTFDALFFGISGTEARYMDPQQRILLEEAWRALEDAGYAADHIKGKACGIFIGCAEGDYQQLFGAREVPAQSFWGNSVSLVPSRIAYHLDLHGPAVAIDTSCSSSLVAVHQACQSLWLGEVEMAIAGGVFIQSTPRLYLSAERAMMLSHGGHCRAFGAGADGFVPGEGVGVVVLKRLSQALADGDHVLALVRGSGTGQDGATNGITAPNPTAQQRLQREVYHRFGVDPAHIQLVEAHGTGTELGDPIEFQALSRSFREFSAQRNFCALGSIKSNIGHLAPAAGIAGLIKIVLAMRHAQIPPTLHCRPNNPQLALADSPFYLSESLHPWPRPARGRRMAAVSSFGFSGTNAHVVIEEAETPPIASSARAAYLIALSAQSWEQVRTLAQRLAQQVREEGADCGDLSYTLLTGRRHLGQRLACVVRSTAEVVEKLGAWAAGASSPGVVSTLSPGIGVVPGLAQSTVAACSARMEPESYAASLASLAQEFVAGADTDFRPLFSVGTFRKLSLPTYPFARQRFWVPAAEAGPISVPAALHPLVHANTSTLAGQRYSSRFSGSEPVFADHRIAGRTVLSAAAQLEMALAAASLALGAGSAPVELSEVHWDQPLYGEGGAEVQVEIAGCGQGAARFEIWTRQADRRTLHSRGLASVMADVAPVAGAAASAASAGEGLRSFSAAECQRGLRHMGLEYGASHRGLKEVRVDIAGNRLSAWVDLPESADPPSRFTLHPGALDSVLQATVGFALAAGDPAQPAIALLPFKLRRLACYQPLSRELRAQVTCTRRTATDAVYDIEIYAADGTLCARLESMEGRRGELRSQPREPQSTPLVASAAMTLLLRPCWAPVSLESGHHRAIKRTVAIGLDAATDVALAAEFPDRMRVNITSADDVDTMRGKLAAQPQFDHLLVVFPGGRPTASGGDELIARHSEAVRLVFRLVKTLIGLGYDGRELRWTVVTRRAQALHRHEPIDPAYAGVHGLMGSMVKEIPNWEVTLLDVDESAEWAGRPLTTLPCNGQGNAWMFRGGQWYEQQLQRCGSGAAASERSAFREFGVYVVIGGAGGIGRVLSEYLIRNYHARIAWLGRRAADEHIESECERLAAFGPRPLYIAADAADEEQLAAALQRVRQELGEINGLVHSAVVLEDKTLAMMSEKMLMRALAAKVDTSVRAAKLLARAPLDFVLFFSSGNSYLKAAGQSNYVAGCLFQDALAQLLAHDAEFPVKVINWGYWGTTGVAANESVRRRLSLEGIVSIDPVAAMGALEDLLIGPFAQLAYVATNRPLAALGVPIRADEAVAVGGEAPPVAAEQLFAGLAGVASAGATFGGHDDRAQIEGLLPPLLWVQIRRAGLLVREQAQGNTAVNIYRSAPSAHDRWLRESLWRIARTGFIGLLDDGRVEIARAQDDAEPDWQGWSAAVQHPSRPGDAWPALADRMIRALAAILRGELAATDAMFPGASLQAVEAIYSRDPTAAAFNASLAEIVSRRVRQSQRLAPLQEVRILEIGAGTGSSTAPLLARLKSEGLVIAEYCYTDISKAFLQHARGSYGAEHQCLTYEVLDIERPEAGGDSRLGRYDLVIAAHVLHATADIHATVQNAKRLLKRNGLLLIVEISRHTTLMHATFGLLEGWWRFRDARLRMPGGPGLDPETWRSTLRELGFTAVDAPLAQLHGQGSQLIVAQSDGIIIRLNGAAAGTAESDCGERRAGSARARLSAGSGVDHDAVLDWARGEKEEATRRLGDYLCAVAASALDIGSDELAGGTKPFSEAVLGTFGMDSLLSANVRERLLSELQVDVPVQALIGQRMGEVIEHVYQQLLLQLVSGRSAEPLGAAVEISVF